MQMQKSDDNLTVHAGTITKHRMQHSLRRAIEQGYSTAGTMQDNTV